MSTIAITTAFNVIKARAEAEITSLPLMWQDDENYLSDTPEPFVFFEMVTQAAGAIEIGSGRGGNRHRNRAELNAYVFAPRGTGMAYVLSLAEPVAAVFRSYRGGGVTFENAAVHPVGEGEALVPPGLSSAAGNYACAVVNAPFFFDQIG